MTEEKKMKGLKAYAQALDYLAKNKSTDTFPNKDHQHAAIAISKILKYSKNSFVIFDDDLKGDITNHTEVVSFRDDLIEYISRGGNVRIVVSDKDPSDDKDLKMFLEILSELYPEQVKIKLASPSFKKKMKSLYDEKINFAVGDKNKYRLERFGNYPTSEKDRKANGSFNDQESIAQHLLENFNLEFNSCENYFK